MSIPVDEYYIKKLVEMRKALDNTENHTIKNRIDHLIQTINLKICVNCAGGNVTHIDKYGNQFCKLCNNAIN